MLEAKVFEAAPSSHRRVHGEHRSFVPPHPTMANGTAPHHEAHEAHKAGRCRGAPPTATARRHYVHPRRSRRSTKYGDVGSHRPTIEEARHSHMETRGTRRTVLQGATAPAPTTPRRSSTLGLRCRLRLLLRRAGVDGLEGRHSHGSPPLAEDTAPYSRGKALTELTASLRSRLDRLAPRSVMR